MAVVANKGRARKDLNRCATFLEHRMKYVVGNGGADSFFDYRHMSRSTSQGGVPTRAGPVTVR